MSYELCDLSVTSINPLMLSNTLDCEQQSVHSSYMAISPTNLAEISDIPFVIFIYLVYGILDHKFRFYYFFFGVWTDKSRAKRKKNQRKDIKEDKRERETCSICTREINCC